MPKQRTLQKRRNPMLLPTQQQRMLPKHKKSKGIHMNIDNRRLIEIQKEKKLFKSLLDKADTISDCLTYQGKLELLENEEKEILKRCDVII